MRHTLIRHRFLDQFDLLFSPLHLLDSNESHGHLVIHVDSEGQHLLFRCFEVNRGTPDLLRMAYARARAHQPASDDGARCALIAPHLSQEAQALCHDLGVCGFDLSGNKVINGAGETAGGPASVLAKQNQAQHQAREQPQVFKGRARHIPLVLLANPSRVWSIRELAHEAQVSIGTASEVLQVLQVCAGAERGWVDMHANKGRGGIRLDAPGELLDAWCAHYTPAATATTELFSLDKPETVEQRLAAYCRQANIPYAFTGASAAAMLRVMGAHADVTLYIQAAIPHIKRLAGELGLLRFTSTTGGIKLLHAQDDFCFYGARQIEQTCIAHPIQIYLDLHAALGPDQAAGFREAIVGDGG
jgi:hypothetical protein